MKIASMISKCRKPAVFLIVFVLCTSTFLSAAAAAEEFSVYGTVERYLWKEFGDDNTRFLEESGLLSGVGFSYDNEFANRVTINPAVELFGGQVDYDGSTQTGIPTTSKVDYFGVNLRGDTGWRTPVTEKMFLEPFVGLGIKVWRRDINNGTTNTGSAVQGYTEQWTTATMRLGLKARMAASPELRYFGEAGVKLPLYNENNVLLSDVGLGSDVVLHPGKQSSLFGALGMKYDLFQAEFYYEGLRFSRSSNVAASGGYIYQPKSMADIFGLKVGVVF